MENVKRLRASRHWSLADLSEQMGLVGNPMLSSGLHRLEQGRRRIDCDDLVALALVFGVSPTALLLPYVDDGEIALTDLTRADARAAWDWVRARRPLAIPEDEDEDEDFAVISFLRDTLPRKMEAAGPPRRPE